MEATVERGSFRDPVSQVFYADGRVLRGLSAEGQDSWEALRRSALLKRFVTNGDLVDTRELASHEADRLRGPWATVLEHERVPFVSYPYEWTFSMLRDAAELQLELVRAALDEDLILKDATPFNVQWRGTKPVFIDIGSFEQLVPGEPWAAYRQFCEQFLFPLFLRAYRGIAFQQWLRGDMEGIAVQDMRRLLRGRDVLRKGVLAHVVLQAKAAARYEGTDRNVREEIKAAGFRKDMIQANVTGLLKVVRRLHWSAPRSEWADYAVECDHVTGDRQAKHSFVQAVLQRRRRGTVWDLGANDGHFSLLAAENADVVVAMDGDELVLDRLYERLKEQGNTTVTPLVIDLANPSPAQGWAGRERETLVERGRPDLVLMLAVIHHLVIGRNIPLAAVIDWLAELGAEVVLEFPPPQDPMVQRLRRNKRDIDVHPDYQEEALRRLLSTRFDTVHEEYLASRRVLFHLTPHP